MGLVFNPFTGNFDFTGSSGGGGGTISGTIAATQVAFGTGADTIGGDNDFTWIDPTLNFTAAHGLSFGSGVASPITVIGGASGSDTAILFDNIPDGYVLLRFDQYTDFDVPNGWSVEDLSGGQFALDGAGAAYIQGDTLTIVSDRVDWRDTHLNSFALRSSIVAPSTEPSTLESDLIAEADSGTDFFEPFAVYGGSNGATQAQIFGIGAFGHLTALGVLSDYGYYLYDFVQSKPVLEVVSANPNTVALGTGMSLFVHGFIATETGLVIDGGFIETSTTSAAAITFQAYDENNATYRIFATLTNGDVPDFTVTPPSGGTVTLNATTLQQAGSTITLGGAFTMSGAFAFTGTITNTTSVTFPTSGTLLTTAGSGASLTFPGTLSIASAKVLTSSNTLTFTGTDGITVAFGAGLSITAGKSLSVSNILTFTGTDSSSVAFGAGGTVQYTGVTKRVSIVGWEALPDTSGNVWLEPASLTQTNDRYPQMVIRFKDTATKDGIGFRFQVPFDYVGGAKFYVNWTTTATTGNAIWDLDYSSASQTSSLDPSADEEALTVTTAAPGSSQTGVVSSMTATAADLAAGDICQGKLSRDGASADTIAADLIAYEVYFEYTN